MADNGVIGRAGEVPWRLATHLKRLTELTSRKPVLFGRRTFDARPRPLPRRPNLVLTRSPKYAYQGGWVVASMEEAIDFFGRLAEEWNAEEAFVLGGAETFRSALDRVTRIHLTRVHAEVEGDATFPELDAREWREVSRQRFERNPWDDHEHSYIVLERTSATEGQR